MSTITNPLWTSLVPGAAPSNPTGNQINLSGSGGSTGSNPLLPPTPTAATAPTSMNPYTAGFSANAGPYAPTNLAGPPVPGAPTTNVGQAAASPIGGMSTMSPKDLSRLFDSLKKSYGDGPAHAILDFLTSGAGFNQQAINNMLAALQPGIERGTESLASQFSASGNRFGSGAQIGIADFLSQVQLNEGQIEAKMYEDSIQRYMDVLMGTSGQAAQTKANSPSFWDNLSSGFGLAGSVGSGIQSIGQSANLPSWLDTVAAGAAAL
jgi:hypothetical protein